MSDLKIRPATSRETVIREIMTMRGCGYQIAKRIVLLSKEPPETFRMVGPGGATARLFGQRRPMSQSEAARIVQAAQAHIALVDEGD